jgi:hypothetical protein
MPEGEELPYERTVNLAAGKTPCWAGATPLLATVPCPSSAWGRSSPQRNFVRCLARGCRRIPGETSEEGKNYPLHFQNCHFFTRRSAYRIRSQGFATTTSAKFTAQKGQIRREGRTPLFCGRSAQKFRGVAPALAGTSRRRFARLHVRAQELVRQNV